MPKVATPPTITHRPSSPNARRSGYAPRRIDVLAAIGAVNDILASAVHITGEQGADYGYNVDATKEAGEPDHAGEVGGKLLWWTWTPSLNGAVTVTTTGSDFDPQMYLLVWEDLYGGGDGDYQDMVLLTNYVVPVPLPPALVLFASVLAGLGIMQRRWTRWFNPRHHQILVA